MPPEPPPRRYRPPREDDPPIQFGKCYRARWDVELTTFLGMGKPLDRFLLAGSVFRPLELRQGTRRLNDMLVIGLGEKPDDAWWAATFEGAHYISRSEFLNRCELCEPASDKSDAANIVRIADTEENPPPEIVLSPPPGRFPDTAERGWKLPDGNYLLAGNALPWPVPWANRVTLPDGTVLDGWTPYWTSTPDGEVVAAYPRPKDYCLEDYAYMHDLHAVMSGNFCVFLWSEQVSHEAITTMKQVVLNGLDEVSLGDLPFDPAG